MYNLAKFTLRDMTECGAALRKLGADTVSLEDAANRIVSYFYNHFQTQDGQSAFALVRLFKTHAFGDLPASLQQIAQNMVQTTVLQPGLKCLTLVATAGERLEWNSRKASTQHQVIPLLSEAMVTQAPMISQLIQQLGLTITDVIAPDPKLLIALQERTYNVFHIPNAVGSPYIPSQAEFVHPYQIQSVLGFGGMLPSGNLMTIILFSKLAIQRETAELFRPLALNAKMAVLPFDQADLFTPESAAAIDRAES